MMQLKANQTYLKSKEQYHLVCRLAQVRVARQMELFTDLPEALPETKENEEEREGDLSPAPLSSEEKEEERERQQQQQQQNSDANEINPEGFMQFFNRVMTEAHASIPLIKVLTGPRLEMLRARCREYGKRAIIDVVRGAASSPFLNGGGNEGWVASIDWILKPNNFPKVLEGQFWQRIKKGPNPQRTARNRERERY